MHVHRDMQPPQRPVHPASSPCWLQVRLAAVQAVTPLVLLLGARAVLRLAGWQDPHQVPVASFFEHTTHVNYCALLAQDASWRVSRRSELPGCGLQPRTYRAGRGGGGIGMLCSAGRALQCLWTVERWHAMCSWSMPSLACLGEGRQGPEEAPGWCRFTRSDAPGEQACSTRPDRAVVQVRSAFMTVLGVWQLQLLEREETEARLLPYLIAGLADAQPEAAAAAAQALDALGALYEHEHAQELQVAS